MDWLLIVLMLFGCCCSCDALINLRAGKLVTTRPARICCRCRPGTTLASPTAYSDQLKWKDNAVREALHSIDTAVEAITAAGNVFNYRNKGQFAIQKNGNGRPIVGLYEKGTNRVVDNVPDIIHSPQILRTLKAFRAFLRSRKVSVYHDSIGTGCYRHIVIRTALATNQIMVCLVTASKDVKHLKEFVACMKAVPDMKSIQWHYNPLAGDQVLRDKAEQGSELCFTRVLSGRDYLEEEIAGVKLRFTLRSFLQSNPAQAAVLYRSVLDCLVSSSGGGGDSLNPRLPDTETSATAVPCLHDLVVSSRRKVWDLYCGVGCIALYLAKTGLYSDIIGVESNVEAVRLARENAGLNNITSGVQFIAGKAEEVITSLHAGSGTGSACGSVQVPATEQYAGQARVTIRDLEVIGQGKNTPAPSLPVITGDDIVILNPPRRGCDRRLLETLLRLQPRTIVYVSCNPTTLARDLEVLTPASAGQNEDSAEQHRGWRVMKVQPVDMFPHTEHVEVVVWLERRIGRGNTREC